MLRRLMFVLALLALVGFGMAQQVVVDPTTGTGADDYDIGVDSATVDQTVTLTLPKATALHLDVTDLRFDLTQTGWQSNLNCVYSTGPDVTFENNPWTVPGGIYYEVGPADEVTGDKWDRIFLRGWGGLADGTDLVAVTSYPPIIVNTELASGSKDYFVCYQTFIMQLFANYGGWEFLVERDDTTDQGIEHLYIQANTCAHFGVVTGLFALDDEDVISLLPTTVTADTTGALATRDAVNNECRSNTSWLDVLLPVAVKINADHHGDSVANLVYTLIDPTSVVVTGN